MPASGNTETEIKLRLHSVGQGRRLLRRAGFGLLRHRIRELNLLFDSPELGLRRKSSLLRLRRAGSHSTFTFKGPAPPGKHKTRQELEVAVRDADVLEAILLECGLRVVFRYEKYRTEYGGGDSEGLVTLDETPMGTFLELEGSPGWIDRSARLLGFVESDYITATYGELYAAYARQHRLDLGEMTFGGPKTEVNCSSSRSHDASC